MLKTISKKTICFYEGSSFSEGCSCVGAVFLKGLNLFVMTAIVQMAVRTDAHHINSPQSEPFSVMNRLNVPELKKTKNDCIS